MIDIGAQSTRPMASTISAEEELDRLMLVLEAIAVYCTSRCFGWSKYCTSKIHKKNHFVLSFPVATLGILSKVFLFHFEKILSHFGLFRVFRDVLINTG